MVRVSTLLLALAIFLCFGPTVGLHAAVGADPAAYDGDRVVRADYQEECQSEGCSNEEVMELYASYREECLVEGCNQEELFELGGSAQGAQAMLADFRRRGLQVRPQDGVINVTCFGTTTSCYGVLLVCNDHCRFGDGTEQPPYVCGACFGFWW
jgi:hypothetical protein